MPPKRRSTAVVLQIHATTQRTPHVQTSGVFKLPVELFFEIFSHFDDHRRIIHNTCGNRWSGMVMTGQCVERSTVTRKLTMTCWALRNTLLPVLWKNTEGCVVRSPSATTGKTYGLYAQCTYLLSNQMIASHVEVMSVDLSFKDAPKDLMTKFVDVLVRLPNLRTLELLDVSHRNPVTRGLKRKCAKFPNIREMTVCSAYPDFIRSCPNLESLTFRCGSPGDYNALSSYGAELKRVGGLHISSLEVECVVQNCPKLQEISFSDSFPGGLWPTMETDISKSLVKSLQRAKNLSVVEIRLSDSEHRPGRLPDTLAKLEAWKTCFIDVLKNSPSKDRKFLRWNVAQLPTGSVRTRYFWEVLEAGELGVLSGPPL